MRRLLFITLLLCSQACLLNAAVRCDNTPGRSWWNVLHYSLYVDFDLETGNLQGRNMIKSSVCATAQSVMELDLQLPMVIDSVVCSDKKITPVLSLIPFIQEDNTCFVMLPFAGLREADTFSITVYFHGKPAEAVNPPWDGGIVRSKDAHGEPWLAMACEGVGASIWWPCKDIRSDEPDEGVDLYYICPSRLTAIGNGRLVGVSDAGRQRKTWHWRATAPINNYNVTFYIGNYEHWNETYAGEHGNLDCSFYVLKGNQEKARKHFAEVKDMLHCFEYWFGAYPFYEDGYKLVEAPYLGMEHQSAVACGNNYLKGYKGIDRSGTGYGLLFDFLVIHESGHEWFGNNITASSPADSWIQEAFTSYSETLYLECMEGKEKARAYQHGKRMQIHNDAPAQGTDCEDGSGDQYDKGGSMIHMIRTVMDDDSLFRRMLREMNRQFARQTVTASMVRQFINTYAGRDFNAVFDQYLCTVNIPRLELKQDKQGLVWCRWTNVVPDFQMPVVLRYNGKDNWVKPGSKWILVSNNPLSRAEVQLTDDFLVDISWQAN